jgi:hypothetical protein
MAENTLKARLVHAAKPTASWAGTEVLKKGELGFEFAADGAVKAKLGDGTSTWSALSYIIDTESNSDVLTRIGEAEQAIEDQKVTYVAEEMENGILIGTITIGETEHKIYAPTTGSIEAEIGEIQKDVEEISGKVGTLEQTVGALGAAANKGVATELTSDSTTVPTTDVVLAGVNQAEQNAKDHADEAIADLKEEIGTLGSAAAKNVATEIADGNEDLPTSDLVYDAVEVAKAAAIKAGEDAVAQEVKDRQAAITQEVKDRDAAIATAIEGANDYADGAAETAETNANDYTDDKIAQEILDRNAAIEKEVGDAIAQEVLDRNAAIKEAADAEKEAREKAIDDLSKEVEGLIAANDAMVYMGVLDASTQTLPAADAGHTYKVSVGGTINGLVVEPGDMLICLADDTAVETPGNWNVIQTNLDGAVISAGTSTAGNIAIFSSDSGNVIEDSEVALEDVVVADNNDSAEKDMILKRTETGATWVSQEGIKAGSAASADNAAAADKLNTDAGAENTPVYFKDGVPVQVTSLSGALVDTITTDQLSQGANVLILDGNF